ncbi:MAG: isochorismatase family protein [Myxococcales bacterium]|nr:isochorismatase family protein [Myxococcales bacterium]
MGVERTKPSTTAVVVVDVQEKLAATMPSARMRDVERALAILLETAAELGAPLLVTEQYPKGLGCSIPPIVERLERRGVTPIHKLTFSACNEPRFIQALKDSGADAAVVLGMEAHVCVFQTVRDLCARGLSVAVPIDGVVSRRDDHRDVGLDLCAKAGATLTTAETLLFDWLVQAGTDTFRGLAKLVR